MVFITGEREKPYPHALISSFSEKISRLGTAVSGAMSEITDMPADTAAEVGCLFRRPTAVSSVVSHKYRRRQSAEGLVSEWVAEPSRSSYTKVTAERQSQSYGPGLALSSLCWSSVPSVSCTSVWLFVLRNNGLKKIAGDGQQHTQNLV